MINRRIFTRANKYVKIVYIFELKQTTSSMIVMKYNDMRADHEIQLFIEMY